MSPPEAAAFLAAHGFTNVDWQVETGSRCRPDGGKGSTHERPRQATPPRARLRHPGSLLDDGPVIMVVDQRDGRDRASATASGQPMP